MRDLKTLMDMTGRRALITGGAGHLGRTMAEALAELGAAILLVDKSAADTSAIAEALRDRWGVKAIGLSCDLEVPEERIRLLNLIGPNEISVLINNAAFVGTTSLVGWNETFEQQSLDVWNRALAVNLTAAFHLSQCLLPRLKEAVSPTIINISSIYGLYAPDYSLYEGTAMGNPAAYSVSKGGLIQLTRWLSSTLAPTIRVNAIAPGGIFRGQSEDFVERYAKRTLLQRMGREEDFKGVIAFLASDLASYITGQVITVDGGWGC